MRCSHLALAFCVSAVAMADEPGRFVVLRAESRSPHPAPETVNGRLARELARQAVLVAARDELGYATRDQRLGEIGPGVADRAVVELTPRTRTYWDGAASLALSDSATGAPIAAPAEANVERLKPASIYKQLAVAWEAASRAELRESLENAGLSGRGSGVNPENLPPARVESLLLEMNWLSQYVAVRAAHQAIAADGASVEWLSVLARGYAHLGSHVEHHWTSAPEVFFARSLLYAERARALGEGRVDAALLRPYALTLAGAHACALAELEAIDKGQDPPAGWASLIEPTCRFDLDEVRSLGLSVDGYEPLSKWLVLCLRRTFGGHRQLEDIGKDAIAASPEAYGAYSNLVTLYPSLGSQRYGAYTGPRALGQNLTRRLGDLPGLIQDPPTEEESERGPDAPRTTAGWLTGPAMIGARLRQSGDAETTPSEPSWSLLASIIEEEVFVMSANHCKAASNATESSLTEEVDEMLPLIENHRFAPYVRLYRHPRDERGAARCELLADMAIDDPRHNMGVMLREVSRLPAPPEGGQNHGKRAQWRAYRSADLRLNSMAEEWIGGNGWWQYLPPEEQTRRLDAYRAVSPHSLHWLRARLELQTTLTAEQVEQWAPLARNDCTASESFAAHFANTGDVAKAMDWYQNAYDLVPNHATAWRLAELHREQGDRDRWFELLDHHLQTVESRGLDHSNLRVWMAQSLMGQDRDFDRAVEYAEQAAQSYSARSLRVAMEANEGLARLERADWWARQLSESYPSKYGDRWYAFRKRNGFQEPDEARPLLDRALRAGGGQRWLRIFLPVLEGNPQEGFKRFHAEAIRTEQAYWYVVSAILAYQLADEQKLTAELAALRRLNEADIRQWMPAYYDTVAMCADLLESPESAELDAATVEARLADINLEYRRDNEFFLGAALQVVGREPELSERLLRSCVETAYSDHITVNLAGYYLSQKVEFVRERAIQTKATAAD